MFQNMFQKFITHGTNHETKISVQGTLTPCTMVQLSSVIDHVNPAYEIGLVIQRTQEVMEQTDPRILEASIAEQIYVGLRTLEGRVYLTGNRYDEPKGVFMCQGIPRYYGSLDTEGILNLIYSTERPYRSSSAFLCNETAALELMRLGTERPIFEKSSSIGVPDRLMGYPCYVDPDAPDNQLLFGDFRKGYLIQRQPFITVRRDPFSQKPHVLFHVSHRVSGHVVDSDAFRLLEY